MNYLQSNNNNNNLFSNELFNSYCEYVEVTETTLKGYIVGLKNFAKWLYDNGIEQPTKLDIKNYKDFLNCDNNFTQGTKANYLRSVKQFFKWLEGEGLYNNVANNIKSFKVDPTKTKKESLSIEDIRTILNSIDRTTEEGKRNYLIILLCVCGGLRTIEIQRADIRDLQTIKGEKVLYIQGKGHTEKDDYIKIPVELEQPLQEYLDTRKNLKPNTPLFTGTSKRNGDNDRLNIKSISRLIKNVLKASGYDSERYTAHSLRHTSATILFNTGADLYKVQKHQRHKNPNTTEIYLHSYQREKDTSEQDIYNALFKEEKGIDPKDYLLNLDQEELKKLIELSKLVTAKSF